jgi:MYXO-CTERM domain-containing protein
MRNLSFRPLAAIILVVGMTGVCLAQGSNQTSPSSANWNPWHHAPEIDPASATTALALLAAGLLVIRGRRRKNTPK